MALSIKEGQRFGRFVAVRRVENQKGYRCWFCRCDCGQEKTVTVRALMRTKSCGCLRNEVRVIKPGDRFNRLTAISYSHRGGAARAPYFVFRCDCGNEKVINGYRVELGLTKSCGCLRRENGVRSGLARRLPRNAGLTRVLYNRYAKRSKDRSIKFSLSYEEFVSMVQLPCIYCGKLRILTVRKSRPIEMSGLDRVDSTKGYESDNVVPCCTKCNIAKHIMTVEAFCAWITDVYTHLVK